jgi:aminoglycoside phosphotransferase (APT) family kinase protein
LKNIVKGLAEYYNRSYPNRVNQTVSEVEDITSGWETELYAFRVEFEEGGRLITEERVARLYTGKYAAGKAAKEFEVMSRLSEAGYPVPDVYNLDTEGAALGKPFVIMERIKGGTVEDALRDCGEAERERLLGVLLELFVDLHNLDAKKVFPGNEIRTTAGYVEGVIYRYRRGIVDSGIPWMEPLIDWLYARRAAITPYGVSVLHRDFHPLNVMLREDGSPAVIDWGACSVGDYRYDLAWTMLLSSTFGDPASRDIILDGYRAVSLREVEDIEFFEVMAILRRLTDLTVSLRSGAEEMGMRSGAVEMMRAAKGHIQGVYDLLIARTGLRLPEFEELLDSL